MSTEEVPPSAPLTLGEQLHLQTRRPLTTLTIAAGVVFVAFANAQMSTRVSFSHLPLQLFLAVYGGCLVGAMVAVRRGVHHPIYLLFNCTETAVLTLGIGLLIASGGSAHSLLWLLYFSTVLHGARAALYRRFNLVIFALTPIVVATIFTWQRNAPSAIFSLGLGAAALYLHQLFLATVDREAALGRERDQLRQIVAGLAVVEERERIARDLHDGFGASLNAALWQARRTVETPAIAAMEHRLMGCLDELGALVWATRREDRDLASFFSHLRARCDDLFGGEVQISYAFPDDSGGPLLDDRRAVAAMYIVLEAVRNSVRHARPAQLVVTGRVDGVTLSIEVRDDGAGFDPAIAERGHGLRHMHERARSVGGELVIQSRPGETSITARLPDATSG